MTSHDPIIVAADGSALNNPGPAGWAWYIDEDNWASGGWKHGTNNMGELTAVLEVFKATEHVAERPLKILCDSQYAINCISKWMPGWKKKGWKKSDGKPVLNQDILKELDAAIKGRKYEFEWVKGHAGHDLNEKADDLARAASTVYQAGKKPNSGPGFNLSGVRKTDTVQSDTPVEALGTGDALETEDLLAELQQSGSIAENGPDQLALEQEALLLKPETYTHENTLDSLLHQDFFWITPAGRRADRATVLEHRERAFMTQGEPEDVSAEMLNEYTALVISTVTTARGQVLRSSTWVRDNYRNEIGAWQLRFRQETAH